LSGVNERRLARLEKMRQTNIEHRHHAGPLRVPTQAEIKRGLVLLVQFSNVKMKSDAATQWESRFNQQGFSLYNHVGSVRDYFMEQSYGLLTVDFDVIGPLTLSKTREYYGSSPNYYLDDRAPEMVIDALKLADSKVDYSDYDWDGDGEVDQVYVIYAGITKSNTSGYIWPHEWCLSNAKIYGSGSGRQKLDDTYIDTYAVSNELADASTLEGIGTACHEFSHCLGFPDFYDVKYSGGAGGQNWDLLDGGNYNGPRRIGEVPSPYTAYERWSAGWIDLISLDEPCRVTNMPAINEQGVAYIISNTGNSNEYYIIENRQPITFGIGNGGHGLMVWHIDYSKTAWTNNSVNTNKTHQRMTFLPADEKVGDYVADGGYYYISSEDEAGDPYPGFSNVTSVKQLTWYTKEKDGTKIHQNLIHDISETVDGRINFTYGDYVSLSVPELANPSDITEDSFVANWLPVEGATSYVLQVEAMTGGEGPATVLFEDFSGFKSVSSSSLISNNVIDKYTQTQGWEVSNLYGTNNASVRVGSSTAFYSHIITPTLKNSEGILLVEFEAASYETDASSAVVSVLNGSEIIATQTIALTGSRATYNCVFEDIPFGCRVKFASSAAKKRYYLYNINLMDMSGIGSTITTYSDLTTTSYTVVSSEADLYYYRVQAVCDEGTSEWSDWMDVDIASSIDNTPDSLPGGAGGEVYDLTGRRQQCLPRRGIYIIDGKIHMTR
jgi:M6 family metalloprotease-like protein